MAKISARKGTALAKVQRLTSDTGTTTRETVVLRSDMTALIKIEWRYLAENRWHGGGYRVYRAFETIESFWLRFSEQQKWTEVAK